MEEKNKSSVGKVILVILLLILFLVGGFFGGKYYTESKKEETKETKEEKEVEKEEELDINSRLVRYLYNMVTYDAKESCFNDWEYRASTNIDPKSRTDGNYKYDSSKQGDVEMNLVGRNISRNQAEYEFSLENIPKVEGRLKSEINSDGSESGTTFSYSKDYVETVYKSIFGAESKIDTSLPIKLDLFGAEELHFDSKSNKYYVSYIETGGTCGPGGLELKFDKAISKGKTLKIYQNVSNISYKPNADGSISNDSKNKIEEKYKYVYTFELEDDGMYKFVSRVKEK